MSETIYDESALDIARTVQAELDEIKAYNAGKVAQLEAQITAQTIRANNAEKALADHMAAEHPEPEPAVCPPGTDKAGQEIPEGQTEAWCDIPDEPPPTGLRQWFGTSYGGGDESMNDGRAEIARCFWNGDVMPNSIRTDADFLKAYNEGVRVFVLSWKSHNDAEVEDFLNDLPSDCKFFGCHHHEIENDVPISGPSATLDRFKATTRRHYAIMREHGVIPGQVFMQYTLTDGSNRDLMRYFVEGAEFVGIDGYINPLKGKGSPENMVDRIVEKLSVLPGVDCSGLTEFAVNNDNPEPVCFDLTKRMRVKLETESDFMLLNTYWPSRGFEFASQRVADAWFGEA